MRGLQVVVALLVSSSVLEGLPIDNVNMYIGTGGHGWGSGSDDMCAQVPFGAWRAGPDTSFSFLDIPPLDHTSGYYFEDNYIRAISHTRLVGAGVNDYGAVGVMAMDRNIEHKTIVKNGYRSKFSHTSEKSSPGYYSVKLETHETVAELVAAGSHSGLHRYIFGDKCEERVVLVDAAHNDNEKPTTRAKTADIFANGIITGSILVAGSLSGRSPAGGVATYFWINVTAGDGSVPTHGVWENEVLREGETSASSVNGSAGAYLRFEANQCGAVELQVGISFVSVAQAQINAANQIRGRSFEEVKVDTRALWSAKMDAISVGQDTDADTRIKMTTALYHSLVAPTQATEEGGAFMGFDGLPHTDSEWNRGRQLYTDMSLWDTHRTQTPLLSLMDEAVAKDIIRSFKVIAQYGGDLPKWPLANVYTGCMTGQHAFVVIADALNKGIVGVDEAAELLPYMIREATSDVVHSGRSKRKEYTEMGYIPCDNQDHATSLTLEYAYDDWALSAVALALGDNATAADARERMMNYRNVFDVDKKFMCARNSNGTFLCRKEAELYFIDSHGDFVEGNAWQWTWFVPHDPLGLVELFGGNDAFATKLNECFEKSTHHPSNFLPNPYYWAGNEPDLLHAWMFVFAQRPDLTQKWTRWLFEHKFMNNPDGIPGNDDYGTMSAWALFAGAGFYPVSGFPYYILGSPAVTSVNLTLSNGNVLSIVAHNWSKDALYVASVKLNGSPLPGPIVMHDAISTGALLEFDMSPTPAAWGSAMRWDDVAAVLWPYE